MNSLFSELNFKILGGQLEDHFFGTFCPEILRSTRDFEKVNLENFGESYVDLVSFRWTRRFCRWTRELSKLNLEIIFLLILVHKNIYLGRVFGDYLLFDGKIEINSKKLRWSPRFLSSTRFEPGRGLMTHPVIVHSPHRHDWTSQQHAYFGERGKPENKKRGKAKRMDET